MEKSAYDSRRNQPISMPTHLAAQRFRRGQRLYRGRPDSPGAGGARGGAGRAQDWLYQPGHVGALRGAHRAVNKLDPDLIASLARFSLTLSCNGVLRETGLGSNVLGHPLAAIAHLMAVLTQQPSSQPIKANELVTTGTVTTAPPLLAGQTWRTELQGIALPGLSAVFTA